LAPEATLEYARGSGCSACRNTGYHGRIGLYEALLLSDDMRDQVVATRNVGVLRRAAIACGMRSLREDGLAKIRTGLTTPEEVIAATTN
jgi:type II secretory ATPase GspE/PulE/Tfp pilus assembly ATPase PilB-like protein